MILGKTSPFPLALLAAGLPPPPEAAFLESVVGQRRPFTLFWRFGYPGLGKSLLLDIPWYFDNF